jgi:hypothetical protein
VVFPLEPVIVESPQCFDSVASIVNLEIARVSLFVENDGRDRESVEHGVNELLLFVEAFFGLPGP